MDEATTDSQLACLELSRALPATVTPVELAVRLAIPTNPVVAHVARLVRRGRVTRVRGGGGVAYRWAHQAAPWTTPLSEPAVIFRHALKVAVLPVIGYSGPAIAGMLTGSIIVETIFGIPGIGPFFVNSVLNRDPFMTCGVVLVFGALSHPVQPARRHSLLRGRPARETCNEDAAFFYRSWSGAIRCWCLRRFLVVLVVLAALGRWTTPATARTRFPTHRCRSPREPIWFGTDVFGRDLLTRTLYGARFSLLIAAAATAISLAVGVTYGMISGYVGGRVDNLMMRLIEIIYSLPTLILVIVLVATLEDPPRVLLHRAGLTAHPAALRPALRLHRPDRMADHGAHHSRAGARAAPAGLCAGVLRARPFAPHDSLAPSAAQSVRHHPRLSDADDSRRHARRVVPQLSWPRRAGALGQLGHARFRGRATHQSDPFLLVDAAFSRRPDGAHPAGAELPRRRPARRARPAHAEVTCSPFRHVHP